MQAAFLGFGAFPPPAPGPDVFVGPDRARARRATDGAVPLVVETVVGDPVLTEVVPDFRLAPRCERIELLEAVDRVELALLEPRASGRVLPPLPGEPGALSRERPPERLDLADLAAALAQIDASVECVAAVDPDVFEHRRSLRLVDLYVHAIAISYFVEQGQGIGVKPPGIEHEDLDRQA